MPGINNKEKRQYSGSYKATRLVFLVILASVL